LALGRGGLLLSPPGPLRGRKWTPVNDLGKWQPMEAGGPFPVVRQGFSVAAGQLRHRSTYPVNLASIRSRCCVFRRRELGVLHGWQPISR
jgi:hypothetical protein